MTLLPCASSLVTLLVLIGLLIVVGAGAYMLLLRFGQEPAPTIVTGAGEEASARLEEARRLTVLLTILLIATLLILLFVIFQRRIIEGVALTGMKG